MQYSYLCTYSNCPAEYYDYMNILYSTTMQKLANYMLDNPHLEALRTNGMDIILISEEIFRETMKTMINVYIQNYKQYANDTMYRERSFVFAIIAIIAVIGVIYAGFFGVVVRGEYEKYHRISQLVKIDSYDISNEELMMQIEEEENEKREKPKKNKKKKMTKVVQKGNVDVCGDVDVDGDGERKGDCRDVSEIGLDSAVGFGVKK